MAAPYRWVVLGVSVVAFFQTHLHRMGFAPLIPIFVADLGLSYAAAGTVQTAYFWTYAVAQVPVGVLADRWGGRRLILLAMASMSAGAVLFALSGGFAASVLSRMLVGLGAAAVWVPAIRLLSEWFPPAERARATGTLSAGGGLGGTVALLVVPWVASLWGWRWAYGLTMLPALAALLLVALLVRPGPAGPPGGGQGGSLRVVLATPALWPFNISVFFCYGAYFGILTFVPAFLVKALGATPSQAGLVTGLITAGTAVSWPLAGWISDRQGRRKPLFVLSQVAIMLGCLYFALAAPGLGLVAAGIAAALIGLLVGGFILPFVMIVELFPPEHAATAAGVTNAACFVAAMVLPIAFGRLVDVTGSFTATFLTGAALQVVALAFALAVRETGPRRA